MNILRHKKWHVRTKENVARVRRDEANAAKEEKARAERAEIAEHEDRVRRLKERGRTTGGMVKSAEELFGISERTAPSCANGGGTETEKHVNLFSELEEQERTNLGVGNKEYEAEKKKEQDDWESKVGIMKRFAEDTKEYEKKREWWEGIPMVRERAEKAKDGEKKAEGERRKFVTKEEKRAMKKERKRRKKEKRRRKKKESEGRKGRKDKHRSSSSSSSTSDSGEEARKRTKLEELRKERTARERQEQAKTKKLLEPPTKKKEGEDEEGPKGDVERDRQRKYHSQFNPEFSRV